MILANQISRILLVDDDPTCNFISESILRDELKFEGEIDVCVHGKDAIDFLKKEGAYLDNGKDYPNPDLILLDINMPVLNGFEFLEEYKNLPVEMKAKIVICMLTSSLNNDDRDKAATIEDLNGYMSKPIDAEGLNEVIEKHFS